MQTLMTRARRGTPLRWLVRTLYVGAMLAAAAVGPIGAQETAPSPEPAAPATLTVVGSVETTSPSLVVRAEDGSQQTFSVDDRSTVPPHLSRGQRVTVTYELTADGARRATAVSPVDSDAPSAAAADRLPPAPARTAEQKAGPPTVAVLGALAALAVGIGFAVRAYTRTQPA